MKTLVGVMLASLLVVASVEGVHAGAFKKFMDGAYERNTPQSQTPTQRSQQINNPGNTSENFACVQTWRENGYKKCTDVDSYSCSRWDSAKLGTDFHEGQKCSDLGY